MATVIFKIHTADDDLAREIANDIWQAWNAWFMSRQLDPRIVAVHAEVTGT